jgi:hypothetical protein
VLARHGWRLVLGVGAAAVLAHPFIPTEEFIHRSDDAYYYFEVAARWPQELRWTFDGIHTTNGVQPLWAVLLCGVAWVTDLVGIDEPGSLARVFVGVTALTHVGASVALYAVLRRTVSVGTGLAAAGAALFPLGAVWVRVWGLESGLYALLLILSAGYGGLVFRPAPNGRRAMLLGVLLGLTVLARLNAVLFLPVTLAWFLWRGPGSVGRRLQLAAVAAGVAALVVAPYLVGNLAVTGDVAPVSGQAKSVRAAEFLEQHGVEHRLSSDFVRVAREDLLPPLRFLAQSRVGDGLWVVGGRVVFDGSEGVRVRELAVALVLLLGLPALVQGPRSWIELLRARLRRLGRFADVAVFAALNAAVSVLAYPSEVRYSLTRWWLVEGELVIVCVTATVASAAAGHVVRTVVAGRFHARFVTVCLCGLVVLSAVPTIRVYWDGEVDRYDWNPSWNDESHRAAAWLEDNVPSGALVGSWNAGVLGWYADQPVVNLDGLINDNEFLTYLEDERTAEYILDEDIEYLSDVDSLIQDVVGDELSLSEVYSHHSAFLNQDYRIYRVDGPSPD